MPTSLRIFGDLRVWSLPTEELYILHSPHKIFTLNKGSLIRSVVLIIIMLFQIFLQMQNFLNFATLSRLLETHQKVYHYFDLLEHVINTFLSDAEKKCSNHAVINFDSLLSNEMQ